MKYFCYYDTVINRRNCNLAAVNKVNYICEKLNKIGLDVQIVSCSMMANEDLPESTEVIDEHLSIYFFCAKKRRNNIVGKVKSVFQRNILLFQYIIKNVKKNETVIAYHSLANMRCVSFARRIKKFKLILEVEEIYNDVYHRSTFNAAKEKKYIHNADMYLFPTEILAQKVNIYNKKQVIVYGSYEIKRFDECKYNDGRIHVAYTGSFDPHKGGLMVALKIARYLDNSFCLHVLGKGSDDVMEMLHSSIEKNYSEGLCEIKYEGLKKGDEYLKYLQRCDLGLSTQNPNASFNNTSFPSKVISYLANNLRVLTAPINVLTQSEFSDYLYYYYDKDPEKIAGVIKNIDFSKEYDSISVIEELDKSFCESLHELLI